MAENVRTHFSTQMGGNAHNLIQDVEKLADEHGISKTEALRLIVLARQLEDNPSQVTLRVVWPGETVMVPPPPPPPAPKPSQQGARGG